MKLKGFTITIFLLSSVMCYSQKKARISTPDLRYYNDTLIIAFSINNCQAEELFTIDPKIFTSNGNEVSASSLSGDLGENIKCGSNKQIIWNLANDDFQINDDIEVQIFADQVIINLPVEEESVEISPVTYSSISRGSIIASSFFFPGLGQKKASRKSGHLLLGVLGYGSLATSAYFILDYNKVYDQYLESTSDSESNDLFLKSEKSYNLSKYLVFGAAGIWTINFIWSAVIPTTQQNKVAVGISPVNKGGIELYAKWTF